MDSIEREVRRALNRLRRAVEKSRRELDGLAGTIRHAEAADFPVEDYDRARDRMDEVLEFVDEEARRLQARILETGGLEPGRVRRSSTP